jgi:hypothetical protein
MQVRAKARVLSRYCRAAQACRRSGVPLCLIAEALAARLGAAR